MTMETTARLALPLLSAGQAQKEVAHNEALAKADFLIAPVAEALGVNIPPGAPGIGQCWIVGDAPAGAWVGSAASLACWSEGGWRFAAPIEGMHVWLRGERVWAVRGASGWTAGVVRAASVEIGNDQVLGARQPAIATPVAGATVDAECRAATAAMLTVLRQHGLIATA